MPVMIHVLTAVVIALATETGSEVGGKAGRIKGAGGGTLIGAEFNATVAAYTVNPFCNVTTPAPGADIPTNAACMAFAAKACL